LKLKNLSLICLLVVFVIFVYWNNRRERPVGKKRITIIDEKSKVVKSGKQHGRIADMGKVALEEAEQLKKKEKKLAKLAKESVKKKAALKSSRHRRGKRYLEAKSKIDSTKKYNLSEAIKLLKSTSISHFNGSVEIHLITQQTGLKGEIKFPNDTGKTTKIAIAGDTLLKQIEKGKFDFDLLLATPQMMPKLAKYAKVLGPKGLMPNPKAGTITDKPEDLARQLAGKVQFKTEAKSPLIHIVIGKVNDKEKNLEENFLALINAVGPQNIKKAVISPTMGPGIKVDISSLI